jgi:hypothetical protein
MSVRLHIGRLVLQGVELEPGGEEIVRRSAQQELARLCSQAPPLPGARGGATGVVHAPTMALGTGAPPADIGVRVAEAIYRSLA